jgi:hypothetical protein
LLVTLGLPAFFQTSTKTVLDELAEFELGGGIEDDGAPLDEDEGRNVDTFGEPGGGFGDLNAGHLPDFFTNPSKSEQENYDIFDAMANQTLEDEPDIGMHRNLLSFQHLVAHLILCPVATIAHLPPGARISSTYPQTNRPPLQRELPPGLGPASTKPAPPTAAVNYKDLLAAMGNPVPQATAAPIVTQQPPHTEPAAQKTNAAPFSYARAVAPSSQGLPQPPPHAAAQAPIQQPSGHVAGPPAVPYAPSGPPGVLHGPAGAFISAHPAYILNPTVPAAPTAGILRGVSTSTQQSGATGVSHSTGFSAQKPLLYNNTTGFSTPSTAPAAGKYHGTAPQYRKELPKGKFMTPSDVRYAPSYTCLYFAALRNIISGVSGCMNMCRS